MAEVLTISEAARELNVAVQTVRSWADKGKIDVIKTSGGQRLFQRSAVERVQQARRAAKGNEAP